MPLLAAMATAQGVPATPAEAVANLNQAFDMANIELFHFGCGVRACLKALAPTLALCAFAAAQEELGMYIHTRNFLEAVDIDSDTADPINDAACFASAAKKIAEKV